MSSSGDVGLAFGLTVGAGLSTTLGALVPFVSNIKSKRMLACALGLSAGVMTYVSFIEIFFKSKKAFMDFNGETHATLSAMGCFFGGMLFAYLLDVAVHMLDPDHDHGEGNLEVQDVNLKNSNTPSPHASTSSGIDALDSVHVAEGTNDVLQTEDIPDAVSSANNLLNEPKIKFFRNPWGWIKQDWKGNSDHPHAKRLHKTGMFAGLAIAIHNFPEGLATFVGALADPRVGIALAVAIAIHNIPEGICVAIPIYYATGSRIKGFLWAFLSGVSEPLGALIGWGILAAADSPLMYAIMFGIVGGMMVYISVKELLPTAHKYDSNDKVTSWSFILGMLIMGISLVLFEYN